MSGGGVTSTGFVPETTESILADIESDQLGLIDPALDTSANNPIGQINGSFADKLANAWDALNTLYSAVDPDAVEGTLQDNLCALTGVQRLSPTPSKVSCNLVLASAATIPAGSRAQVTGQPTNTWVMTGPTGQLPGDLIAPTSGTYACDFQAEINGPVVANAGTLTVILSPVSGWTSITNPLDANLGTLLEEDTDLRVRREDELVADGAANTDSIREALLKVPGVIQAFCFENTTGTIDANGTLPHGIQVVIYDGLTPQASNAAIAAVIWAKRAAGAPMTGTTTVNIVDSTGESQTVSFNRATIRNVYFDVNVLINPATFPSDGTTQIQNALVALSLQRQGLAQPVRPVPYENACLSIAGVEDIEHFYLDFIASPIASATLPMTSLQVGAIDASRITVNTTTDTSPPPGS